MLYIIPVLVFLLIVLIVYYLEKDQSKKKKPRFLFVRAILPGFTMALVTFLLIKYKGSDLFVNEQVMKGNYFDSVHTDVSPPVTGLT